MKKTLIALGLASTFGVVHAESSVTMYGTINMAVTKKGNSGLTLKAQEYRYASNFGIKGQEDLGNGYLAIFKLEAELEPDTGSGAYGLNGKQFGFNQESYVGLVTPVGAFRVGRSTTPFANMWVGGGYGYGRGVGEFTGGLAGSGLQDTQPEVASRWNNALFYDMKKGGFAAGVAVTTSGSQSEIPTRVEPLVATKDIVVTMPNGAQLVTVKAGQVIAPATLPVNNEGQKNTKPAYGGYARYEGQSGKWGYKLGAAYQVDNGGSYTSSTNSPAEAKNAWIVGAGLSYGPVSLEAGYAIANLDNTHDGLPLAYAPLRTGKSKTFYVGMAADLTANDKIYTTYGRYKRTNYYNFGGTDLIAGKGDLAGSQLSLGYEHHLSKRTLIYTDVRRIFALRNNCSSSTSIPSTATAAYTTAYVTGQTSCGVSQETVNSVLATESGYSYDIGISHSF